MIACTVHVLQKVSPRCNSAHTAWQMVAGESTIGVVAADPRLLGIAWLVACQVATHEQTTVGVTEGVTTLRTSVYCVY
jgi:hypothetical protein